MKVKNNILLRVENSDIINGTFKIPNNITIIADHCFGNLVYLNEISIPQNVTEIQSYAFEKCPSLTMNRI